MALESATYINDLNASNPASSDSLKEADDHLRLVKQVIKNTFPNITGPVTANQGALNSPFPVGGIIMWSGSIASIPTGWTLCNGTAVPRSDGSGTITPPDLRNRFIVGAGDTYAVAATGGATSVTLATGNLPSHNHSISVSGSTAAAGAHSHGVNDPGHAHNYTSLTTNQPHPTGSASFEARGVVSDFTTTASGTGISIAGVGDHVHALSISASIGNTGSGTAFGILPPYYALAYIMKI
jgi:microcystin-dependent protein